jgi:hypothetical protein
MSRMPKEARSPAIQNHSRRNSSPYNRAPRILHCCGAAQLAKKLPHCWWEHNGTIYKGRYCEAHKAMMLNGSFPTKNQLIAYLTTQKLLGLENEDPPF